MGASFGPFGSIAQDNALCVRQKRPGRRAMDVGSPVRQQCSRSRVTGKTFAACGIRQQRAETCITNIWFYLEAPPGVEHRARRGFAWRE